MLNRKIIGIALLLLFLSDSFSIRGYDADLYRNMARLFLCVFAMYTLIRRSELKKFNIRLKWFVLGLIIIPFLGFIPAYILHEQNIILSFIGASKNIGYVFFFYLLLIQIEEKKIVKTFCILGFCWVFIELIQQFTYPHYWFASRYETYEKSIEVRNGIYRYSVAGVEFGLILLFYCFERFMLLRNIKYLVGIIAGLVGVYLTTTRQVIAMSIICLFVGMFLMKKIKFWSFVFFCAVSLIVYMNVDTLFGEFIKMTEDVDEDYIRFHAYRFYGITYNDGDSLAFLLGNGSPYPPSSFYKEISKYEEVFGLFIADIGIVGMYSQYGIIYVMMILWFFVYVFKHRKYLDLYLQLYVLFMAGTSIMLHHFAYKIPIVVTGAFILYLIEQNIAKNKRLLRGIKK